MAFHINPPPPDINLVAGHEVHYEIIADFAHEWSWTTRPQPGGDIRGFKDKKIRAIAAEWVKENPDIQTFGDAWNGIQLVHYHADARSKDFYIRRVYLVGRPLKEGSAKIKISSRYSYDKFGLIYFSDGDAEISINVAPSDYSPGDGSEAWHHDHHPDHEPLLKVSPAVRDAAVKKRKWVTGYAYGPGSPEQVETLTRIDQLTQNETEETPTLIRQATVRNSPEWLGTNQRHLSNTDGIVHVDWTDLQHYDLLVAHPSGGSGFLEMDEFPSGDRTWEVTSSDHQAGKQIRIAAKVIPAAGEHTVTLTARNACGPSERTFRIVVPSS